MALRHQPPHACGHPTLEDEVAQRAIVMVLEAIYEQDFLSCSYGFRPGRSAHQALQALRDACMDGRMSSRRCWRPSSWHHVPDEWYVSEARPRLRGNSTLVRFADDFVMAFEDVRDAERMLAAVGKRFEKYGLMFHPGKTRFVDFLGFTHVWGKSRQGYVVRQVTAKSRLARGRRRRATGAGQTGTCRFPSSIAV